MADGTLSLSNGFDEATEADWLAAVEKALKGGGLERITRQTRDGIKIHPLYRETDFASGSDPRGAAGTAPFLRGETDAPNPYLPWDIRQSFAHPDPAQTNREISARTLSAVSHRSALRSNARAKPAVSSRIWSNFRPRWTVFGPISHSGPCPSRCGIWRQRRCVIGAMGGSARRPKSTKARIQHLADPATHGNWQDCWRH